jgi:pimeloyl-ACP methyl ester carboxylesterase
MNVPVPVTLPPPPSRRQHQQQSKSSYNDSTPSSHTHSSADYSPLTWESYFDKQYTIDIGNQYRYMVYESVVAPHETTSSGITFVLLHGGGQSSLSFALLAKHLKSYYTATATATTTTTNTPTSVRIIAYDLRGHGLTTLKKQQQYDEEHDVKTSNTQVDEFKESISDVEQNTVDLSMSSLIHDSELILQQLVHGNERCILIGHSLSGALAAKLAYKQQQQQLLSSSTTSLNIVGVVVIDLVQSTAIDSMSHIVEYLKNRPTSFTSVNQAIEWSVTNGQMIGNIESARISIPPQLKAIQDDNGKTIRYEWVTDLLASKPYWNEWFAGLNNALLGLKIPKLLIVANTDRLDDSELMIAQMQGKIRVECVGRGVGHSLQEDKPIEAMKFLVSFVQRHINITPFVLPTR